MEGADNQNQGTIPPKQTPFTTVTSGAPKTIVLKRPTLRRPGEAPSVPVSPSSPAPTPPPSVATVPPSTAATPPKATPIASALPIAQGIAVSHNEALKKITSRISVSSATSPIPPISPSGTANLTAAKKMTSRISLESAFSNPAESASSSKTIKLKRPTISATPPSVPVSPSSPPDSSNPSTLTPIPPPQDDSADSPTRRKTIKVKKPTAASTPKINLGGDSDVNGVASPHDNLQNLSGYSAVQKTSAPDEVNPVFIVAAIIAVLAGSLLTWTLTSQTFGPRGAAGFFATAKGPSIPPPPGLMTFD